MRALHSAIGIGLLVVFFGTVPLGHAQERATILPSSSTHSAPASQQQAVYSFLKEYFSALAGGEMAKLAAYHPSLTPEQLDYLRDYFAHTIRALHIHLKDVHVQLAANTATVDFYRTDRFIDRPTNRSVEKSIQLSTTLIHSATGWRLAGLDQIAFALGESDIRLG